MRQTLQQKFKRAFSATDPMEESSKANMITDEKIESQQNTDPASDPTDSPTTGVATEATALEHPPELPDLGSVPAAEFLNLKNERDQLLDRIARLQAEFDNSRKREARERTDFREYAVSGAVEQFLPVVDNGARESMSRLLRGLAAGYGARKLGGGCFSTVLVFVVLWWLLGHFGLFR